MSSLTRENAAVGGTFYLKISAGYSKRTSRGAYLSKNGIKGGRVLEVFEESIVWLQSLLSPTFADTDFVRVSNCLPPLLRNCTLSNVNEIQTVKR
jgi:hypothetical protein